jgi:peptidoglycan/LPS O-acetylase OafA/YrhL
MGKIDPKFNLLDHVGTYFGIPSFFILSSFLLTYKLLETINKSNGSFNEIQTIALKYLIRRFFRIYVPYFIFCSYMSAGFSFSNQRGFLYDSWFNMISLTKTGANHLWTCIPEMKYYLFIPLFTFTVYKTQK